MEKLIFSQLKYLNPRLFFAKIKQDAFFKNYIIFFSGSILAAFLNYLFYPVLGRLLDVADFGEVQALLSLATELGLFFSVFSPLVVNISANIDNKQEQAAVIGELKKIVLVIISCLLVGILVFAPYLQNFFHFDSFYPFIGLGLSLLVSALYLFKNAYLQGQSDFKAISISAIMVAAGRLLFAALLVVIGFRVLGVVSGLVLSQLAAYSYVFYKTRNVFKKSRLEPNLHVLEKNRVKKELLYGLLILVATGCITILYTSDILLVKRFFTPEIAGLYSGVSLVAKIVFFAITPLAGILLPSVKLNNTASENHAALQKALFILSLVGIPILLFFSVSPNFVVSLLMGHKYLPLVYLLPKLTFLMLLISLANLFFCYYLALRRFFLMPLALGGLFVLLGLLALSDRNLDSIINNFIYATGLILMCLAIRFFLNNSIKKKKSIF